MKDYLNRLFKTIGGLSVLLIAAYFLISFVFWRFVDLSGFIIAHRVIIVFSILHSIDQ